MLSFSDADDVGTQVLQHVFETLRIGEEWSVRLPRGFTWWAGDFGQSVWSLPPVLDGEFELHTLYAVTDVLQGFVPTAHNLQALNQANAFGATLSALVVPKSHPDRLCLMAKMMVHEGIVNWAANLFSLVVAMQAADAQHKAQALMDQLGGHLAVSPHPFAGLRGTPDDILNVHRMLAMEGKQPSTWRGGELTSLAEILNSAPGIHAVGNESAVTVDLPFPAPAGRILEGAPPATSRLDLNTTERHPQIGRGLAARLTLPVSMPAPAALQAAHELNQIDAAEGTTHLLGAWCASSANALSFVSFYPNSIQEPGAAMNIAFSLASRARWAGERLAAGRDGAA